ncbi:hypothetical protein AAVH_14641 [Aphelenchoides avenae]|nr:hypothetical protein AAVH_14641 [Aphelenchus avenae]
MMRGNSMYLLLANLAVADLIYLSESVVSTAFVKYTNIYLRAFGSYVLQLAIFASICTNVSVCIERGSMRVQRNLARTVRTSGTYMRRRLSSLLCRVLRTVGISV